MKTVFLKLSFVLIIIGTAFNTIQAQEVSKETMAKMTTLLDLSDVQQGQMNDLMVKYRGSIDWILTKYEGEDEPDVGAMIGELRGERDGYRNELKGVLSTNQYDTYRAKTDQILTDMFRDLAEIRLWEVQKAISLTDKQVTDLTPIVGKSMKQTVQLLFENAGQRLSLPKKIKIKNTMQKIEKDKRDAMGSILTPAQLGAYDQYKEEQKAARKK